MLKTKSNCCIIFSSFMDLFSSPRSPLHIAHNRGGDRAHYLHQRIIIVNWADSDHLIIWPSSMKNITFNETIAPIKFETIELFTECFPYFNMWRIVNWYLLTGIWSRNFFISIAFGQFFFFTIFWFVYIANIGRRHRIRCNYKRIAIDTHAHTRTHAHTLEH